MWKQEDSHTFFLRFRQGSQAGTYPTFRADPGGLASCVAAGTEDDEAEGLEGFRVRGRNGCWGAIMLALPLLGAMREIGKREKLRLRKVRSKTGLLFLRRRGGDKWAGF